MKRRSPVEPRSPLEGLLAWENEGGAFGPAHGFDGSANSNDKCEEIFVQLGRSVVDHWDELPLHFKELVFRDIATREGQPDIGLKGRIAKYLHAHHRSSI
jgi:hypothetical protein